MSPEQEKALALARARQRAQQANSGWEQDEARQNMNAMQPALSQWQGSILPVSKDEQGNAHFDSNAGIIGDIKRAFMLPGDVMSGQVDPSSDEAIARSLEFASTFSPINPGVRAGDNIVPGVARNLARAEVPVPTQDALKAAAKSDFNAMRDTNVDYLADAVKRMAETTKVNLEEQGFDPEVAGKTHKILDKLSSPPEGGVANIRGLHSARKTFGKIAQNFNDPADQSAASQAIQGLDDFITAADPQITLAGSAPDAAALLQQGNANFAASKRSKTLTDLMDASQLRANAANSGANLGNTTRQRVANLLLNNKASSGFSPEELAALRSVNEGSFAANSTRRVGNMLGGGGGIGASMIGLAGAGAGAMTGDLGLTTAGASLPLAGAVSRQVSNVLTERALRVAEELVRSRSPLYQSAVEAAPLVPQGVGPENAVIRALLLSGQ